MANEVAVDLIYVINFLGGNVLESKSTSSKAHMNLSMNIKTKMEFAQYLCLGSKQGVLMHGDRSSIDAGWHALKEKMIGD